MCCDESIYRITDFQKSANAAQSRALFPTLPSVSKCLLAQSPVEKIVSTDLGWGRWNEAGSGQIHDWPCLRGQPGGMFLSIQKLWFVYVALPYAHTGRRKEGRSRHRDPPGSLSSLALN